MTAEIGQFCIIVALIISVAQSVIPLIGASRNDISLMSVGNATALIQFILLACSFCLLIQLYVTSDFSVLNVWQNSHSQKPLLYKISGTWGNHEGSLLLWVLILSLFGAAVAFFGKNLPHSLKARVLAIQSMVSVGFLFLLVFLSNPFARISPTP